MKSQRGSALIMVLWLSAVLTAMAFALGTDVRRDAERAAAQAAGLQASYLARAAIDRELLRIAWGKPIADATFEFPAGKVRIVIVYESTKRDINTIEPRDLARLLLASGEPAEHLETITQAVAAFRRQANFGELDELLLVPGITPDTYFGHYAVESDGHASWHPGLRDSLTATPSGDVFTIRARAQAALPNGRLSPTIHRAEALVRSGAGKPVILRWRDNPYWPEP